MLLDAPYGVMVAGAIEIGLILFAYSFLGWTEVFSQRQAIRQIYRSIGFVCLFILFAWSIVLGSILVLHGY